MLIQWFLAQIVLLYGEGSGESVSNGDLCSGLEYMDGLGGEVPQVAYRANLTLPFSVHGKSSLWDCRWRAWLWLMT
jgi:hypothetical protein